MSTQRFDISSLLWFNPPNFMCQKCYALLKESIYSSKTRRSSCPICGVEYLETKEFPVYRVHEYLQYRTGIDFGDLFEHSRKLAAIAHTVRNFEPHRNGARPTAWSPPMRALFQALLTAKQFVHLTSFGIDYQLLGALKMAAQQVKIRGIVSGVASSRISELTEHGNEAPDLEIKVFKRENWDGAHQKIIVIDGLLAFKGSANLTLNGWRNAAQGRDMIEVVTDVGEVVNLHNRYFSPIWAEFSDIRQIAMWPVDDLPF